MQSNAEIFTFVVIEDNKILFERSIDLLRKWVNQTKTKERFANIIYMSFTELALILHARPHLQEEIVNYIKKFLSIYKGEFFFEGYNIHFHYFFSREQGNVISKEDFDESDLKKELKSDSILVVPKTAFAQRIQIQYKFYSLYYPFYTILLESKNPFIYYFRQACSLLYPNDIKMTMEKNSDDFLENFERMYKFCNNLIEPVMKKLCFLIKETNIMTHGEIRYCLDNISFNIREHETLLDSQKNWFSEFEQMLLSI